MNIDRRLERLLARGEGLSMRSEEEKVRRTVTSDGALLTNLFTARPARPR